MKKEHVLMGIEAFQHGDLPVEDVRQLVGIIETSNLIADPLVCGSYFNMLRMLHKEGDFDVPEDRLN